MPEAAEPLSSQRETQRARRTSTKTEEEAGGAFFSPKKAGSAARPAAKEMPGGDRSLPLAERSPPVPRGRRGRTWGWQPASQSLSLPPKAAHPPARGMAEGADEGLLFFFYLSWKKRQETGAGKMRRRQAVLSQAPNHPSARLGGRWVASSQASPCRQGPRGHRPGGS